MAAAARLVLRMAVPVLVMRLGEEAGQIDNESWICLYVKGPSRRMTGKRGSDGLMTKYDQKLVRIRDKYGTVSPYSSSSPIFLAG